MESLAKYQEMLEDLLARAQETVEVSRTG